MKNSKKKVIKNTNDNPGKIKTFFGRTTNALKNIQTWTSAVALIIAIATFVQVRIIAMQEEIPTFQVTFQAYDITDFIMQPMYILVYRETESGYIRSRVGVFTGAFPMVANEYEQPLHVVVFTYP